MIQYPTGRTDDNLSAAPQCLALWPQRPPANKLSDSHATSAVERGEYIPHLTGKLTCRHQYYRLYMTLSWVYSLDKWQPEGDSLAGAGARLTYYIAAGQEWWNSSRLN
jgi:hypothetical protein